MQCVILAGGLGTRMRPLTEYCPKHLLPVGSHPFGWYQLHWLADHGVTDVVYCIGHQGEQIRQYWQGEIPPVRSLQFVDEGEALRGTGGALRLALEQEVLDQAFFVLYGDSFLPIDFRPVWDAFEESGSRALMTVLRNAGRWDSSNVIYANGRVLLYDKRARRPDMQYIDYGLSALQRHVVEQTEQDVFDLSDLFNRLSVAGQLAGYEVFERFYEIGSPAGLRDFEGWLQPH